MFNKRYDYKRYAILLVLIALVVSIFATPITYCVAETISFDKINVMDDLLTSTVNGKKFVVGDYIGKEGKPELLTLAEYCYEDKENSKYALYVYVWSPKRVELDMVGHRVQLAIDYDHEGLPVDYANFTMTLLSTPKDSNYKNLFYKFKVQDKIVDSNNIWQRASAYKVKFGYRRYDVTGIELRDKGSASAIDNKAGGSYRYSGYAKNMNGNIESNLNCTVGVNEVVELSPYQTTYRPASMTQEGLNNNIQHNLSSVYFSVPNFYLIKYGRLQAVKAEWYEYLTKVIGITNNKSHADIWKNSNNLRTITDSFSPLSVSDSFLVANLTWSFNAERFHIVPSGSEKASMFPYMIYDSTATANDFNMSRDDLVDYMFNYPDFIDPGNGKPVAKVDIGSGRGISSLLVDTSGTNGRKVGYDVKNIDYDDKFDMLAIDNRDWWNTFWDKITGKNNVNEMPNYSDLSPIHEITDKDLLGDDEKISQRLCVNASDVASLKDYYRTQRNKNEKTFILRFALTEYKASKMFAFETGKVGVTKHVGTLAQQSMFFNFDILSLTFNKEGVFHVIGAVSSPLDVVGDVSAEQGRSKDIDWWDLIKKILAIITIVIVLILFMPLWLPLVQLLLSVIAIPFRLIKNAFRNIGKSKKK